MARNGEVYVIKGDGPVKLSELPTDDHDAVREISKDEGASELEAAGLRLGELQELLFAEHAHKLLIVLQGMDTSGKDGVVRHVFDHVNPQGVNVVSFKVPTTVELEHDYLWRVHQRVPALGEITIFNRSHYEDVLTVRVHGKISRDECERRYRQIVEFERMLVEEGTTILKFFLHVSKDEQLRRLEHRVADPRKHWKFSYGDIRERAYWHDYQEAYAELLEKTSTKRARWHAIPSDRKWYRNLAVARVIVATLEGMKMRYPESPIDLDALPAELRKAA